MDELIQEKSTVIKNILIDVFQEFYYRQKKNGIYAFSFEIDEALNIQNFLLSTKASLFNEEENKQQYLVEEDKWNITKWKHRIRNSDDNKRILDNFQSDPAETSLLYRLFTSTSAEPENNAEFELLMDSFEEAISYLSKIYKLDLTQIVFFIYAPHDSALTITSAQRLNKASSLLFEFIASINISIQQLNAQPIKLNQADKDLLIDLAQIVEMTEPYDALFVAHQAYLLSFEPMFKDANFHIQNLIQHISSIDNHDFALSKEEILNRILQFYKV